MSDYNGIINGIYVKFLIFKDNKFYYCLKFELKSKDIDIRIGSLINSIISIDKKNRHLKIVKNDFILTIYNFSEKQG